MQPNLQKYIDARGAAIASNHRQMVVLSGTKFWTIQLLKTLTQYQPPSNCLVVNQDGTIDPALSQWEVQCGSAHTKHQLGTEIDALIWDGFSGFNPDAFGIASGLITGGGVCYLMLPPLDEWEKQADRDYLRMCRSTEEWQQCSSYFLQRCSALMQGDSNCLILRENEFTSVDATLSLETTGSTDFPLLAESKRQPVDLNTDQQHALQAIDHVVHGHRHRPLVITADRGRGKTTILGIAAAQILLRDLEKKPQHVAANPILITAPNKRSIETAFRHFQNYLKIHAPQDASISLEILGQQLQFIPCDSLVSDIYPGRLLLVDEAAAIPTPMLRTLLHRYPRTVFASTLHGYEGNGQGFAVRFKQTLDSTCPEWKKIELSQPIRWAPGDPLEKLTFQMLCLDATLNTLEGTQLSNPKITKLERSELHQNEALLKQLTALLVSAHYQTSPSDVRLLLDHPAASIFAAMKNESLLGAILCINEGGQHDLALSEEIALGHRRPKGHLIPQTLTMFSGQPEIMSYPCIRIMRIAVHPDVRRQQLGSKLLQHVIQFGKRQNKAYVASSFGITSTLAAFWYKNGFRCARLGMHKDAASGTQAALYSIELEATVTNIFENLRSRFIAQLIDAAPHALKDCPWQHVDILLSQNKQQMLSGPLEAEDFEKDGLPRWQERCLYLFAFEKRAEYDSALALTQILVWAYLKDFMAELNAQCRSILVMRLLQRKDWATIAQASAISGRKEGERQLRLACRNLYQLIKVSENSEG